MSPNPVFHSNTITSLTNAFLIWFFQLKKPLGYKKHKYAQKRHFADKLSDYLVIICGLIPKDGVDDGEFVSRNCIIKKKVGMKEQLFVSEISTCP